jgi:hypothetical protein
MKLFAVVVNRDDTVRVVARDVQKTTRLFYYIGDAADDIKDFSERWAFGYRSRIGKDLAHTSARSALEAYMKRRKNDKQNALSVAGQATKQIASANELLMHLPPDESPQPDPAVAGNLEPGKADHVR